MGKFSSHFILAVVFFVSAGLSCKSMPWAKKSTLIHGVYTKKEWTAVIEARKDMEHIESYLDDRAGAADQVIKARERAEKLEAKARADESDTKKKKSKKGEIDFTSLKNNSKRLNLFFDFNSTVVRVKYYTLLKKLKIKKKSKVYIHGFSDSSGPADFNFAVSKKRALGVRYILKKKFRKASFEIIPHGEEKPPFTNLTMKGRRKNRRVLVIVQ